MSVLCSRSVSITAKLLPRRIASIPTRRMFGTAAAAVELDYETDWEDVYRSTSQIPAPAAEEWWELQGRGVQWVFMGTPSAQKRFYATRIAQLLEVPYISMGTLVRQELHPRSSLYMKIANAVNEGKLVPEDIIFGLLSKRLEEGYSTGETGFVLDGIPRTRIQAEILDQITDIDLVVNFKCAENCLFKKHFGNQICAHCGEPFDMFNSQSTSLNPYLTTGTNTCNRHASIKTTMDKSRLEKMQIYSEQNKLLEDYYEKQKKLLNFLVSGGPGETWRGLLAALRLQQVHAASLSNKLTAS